MMTLNDGVMRRRIEIDAKGQALSLLDQPNAGIIMRRTAELRKNPGSINHMQHMGLECTIPLAHWYQLEKYFPGITKGGPEAESARQAFLRHPVSDHWRVRDQKRGMQ